MARTRTAGLCLPSRFLRIFHGFWEWSLTAQGTFGTSTIRQETGAPEGHKRVSRNRQLNKPDPRPDQHPGEEPETREKAKGAVMPRWEPSNEKGLVQGQ
jgi:hypothetical protein